ncbi:protein MIZU-KUSSEI 1-like [Hibiscus syriacus]|nr:protein MIZU-KUSSEI 1-like [Hibiscus syriacus]
MAYSRTSNADSRDVSSAAIPLNPSSPKSPSSPPPPPQPFSLIEPSELKSSNRQKSRVFRAFLSVFRSFPILTPSCTFPVCPTGLQSDTHVTNSGTLVTGTLFGYRKGKVILSIQETPKCLPSLVLELAMQTNGLQKELSSGMVRIALECEKQASGKEKVKLLDEPVWTMFCNGKKTGLVVRRDATEEDLNVMELLNPVSMGAGVLQGNSETEGVDGELAYIRPYFDRVVGSKDSETLYMLSPDGNNGDELSIFMVRL